MTQMKPPPENPGRFTEKLDKIATALGVTAAYLMDASQTQPTESGVVSHGVV